MPAHSDKYHSSHSAKELFDIVADVEKYPEFLPWVTATRITERFEKHFVADMVVNFKGLTQKYTSKVDLITDKNFPEIDVGLVKGPFKHLKTHWIFEPAEKGTNIIFELDFKFQSAVLEKMIGYFFEKAVGRMTDAFIKRADDLLGTST